MTDQQIKKQQSDNLRRLIKYFDYNRQKVADAFGVTLATVYTWTNRGRISAKASIKADELTHGKITKVMLRPDVRDWIDEA